MIDNVNCLYYHDYIDKEMIIMPTIPTQIRIDSVVKEHAMLDAMAEAKRISNDPNILSYSNIEDLKASLLTVDMPC